MSGHRSTRFAWLLVALAFAGACGDRPEVKGDQSEAAGTIHLSLSAGLADGIAAVRVDVLENGAIVTSRTVQASPSGTTPPLADAYFILAPGLYTVIATPLDANGARSEQCQSASTSAVVNASATTEVTLTLLCNGNGNGGIDVVITTTHPPVITGLEFDPSKFTQVCEPVKITAQASSPDAQSIGLTYDWTITSAPADDTGAPPPGAAAELVSNGSSAIFDTRAAGDYTLKVVVTDANGLSASLSFPVHVLPGDACNPVVPSDNSGATLGKITIGGHVTDRQGTPLVGAQITLAGAAQAVRFSDLTGGFVFHVDPGAYSLTARPSLPT